MNTDNKREKSGRFFFIRVYPCPSVVKKNSQNKIMKTNRIIKNLAALALLRSTFNLQPSALLRAGQPHAARRARADDEDGRPDLSRTGAAHAHFLRAIHHNYSRLVLSDDESDGQSSGNGIDHQPPTA